MLELLTGLGLSASAGLNAWIPLLTVGLLARYTTLLNLPDGWQWLTNGWLLGVLAVLLVVELIADKVPVVDSVNDVLQTVLRPGAGGVVFGAGGSSQTLTVADPSGVFADGGWVPITTGVVIALVVHLLKATARAALNTVTVGLAAPVLSTVEDGGSVALSLVAILLPALVIVLLIGFLAAMIWAVRYARARRRAGRFRPATNPASR